MNLRYWKPFVMQRVSLEKIDMPKNKFMRIAKHSKSIAFTKAQREESRPPVLNSQHIGLIPFRYGNDACHARTRADASRKGQVPIALLPQRIGIRSSKHENSV